MDRREVTLEIIDDKKARDRISKDPRMFGVWMRDVLTGSDASSFDSAQWNLREEYGVAVTSTRSVFNPNS